MAGQGIQKPQVFAKAIEAFGRNPLIVCHNDADGLSAGVILKKALERRGMVPAIRIVGKGENAYSEEFQAELAKGTHEGLILTDVGTSAKLSVTGPAVIIDHHVPTGLPDGATVISGIEDQPIPTSSLLAYRCAQSAGAADGLLWLAAIGIIGDMAENDGFAEMEAARAFGITALRKAASLVNAPRRSASGDASPAFALLEKADGPKAVLSGEHPETEELLAAKAEVNRDLEAARKIGPKIVGDVAVIRFHSPCQIHPLVAQAWRGRLKDKIVIAVNGGYRPGWVHFAARTATNRDLIAFFAEHRPPGAGEQYGNGHRAASGGALHIDDWNQFVRSVGFGPDLEIHEKAAA
ncbi:DHH family phosphoesterase [Aureimonas psammosilenae]|uniref:DHH family phosphoesterase n=1 Tax=Aureimonas psammosilenae TaxID=2495496 RepID=UPI001260C0B2|nr:DHH family phosphoesterase [Aureimonas psammosilenae]